MLPPEFPAWVSGATHPRPLNPQMGPTVKLVSEPDEACQCLTLEPCPGGKVLERLKIVLAV